MRQIEQLYETYKQDVYRYLLGMTHDTSLAEDLLSETFVAVIRSLPGFRGESSEKTWMLGIARHMWLQHLRKKRAVVAPDELLHYYVLVDGTDMAEKLVHKEQTARVRELLEQKDERSKNILLMRAEGYAYAEIGEKWAITESTARVIDFRTRAWLRKELTKDLGEEGNHE